MALDNYIKQLYEALMSENREEIRLSTYNIKCVTG